MARNAETSGSGAAESASSAKEDMDLLKEDLARLRQDLQAIMKDVRGFVSDQAKDSVEKGKVFARDAGEQIDSARDDVQERVREHPLTAIGLAFGAGVLLAMLSRK